MKSLFLLLALVVVGLPSLHAQPPEKIHYRYGALGAVGGFPVVGGGYRMHHGYHGFDVSGTLTPWITLPAAQVHGLYLFYPRQNGFYVGGGLGVVREAECWNTASPSFDAVAGYEWRTARGRNLFLQVGGTVPFRDHPCTTIWPTLTFGFAF